MPFLSTIVISHSQSCVDSAYDTVAYDIFWWMTVIVK